MSRARPDTDPDGGRQVPPGPAGGLLRDGVAVGGEPVHASEVEVSH